MKRIGFAAMVAAVLVVGCGGPKPGGVYVTSDLETLWVDYPGGGDSIDLGSGSIVRVIGEETEGDGTRYLKVYVERQTGPGGKAHEGRTGYLKADGFDAAPTAAP